MRYLLDTNTIVALTRRNDLNVKRQIATYRGDIAVSSIVIHELYYGAFSSDRADFHLGTIRDLPFQRVEFSEADARMAAEVRAFLRRAGTPIGPYDVLIAGQALSRNLILVTNNVREFSRVEGLIVQDWTSRLG